MVDSWLSPDGDIIEVGQFQHNEYASDLLKEEMGIRELFEYKIKNNFWCSSDILHKRGWVRIEFHTTYLPKIQFLGNCIDLTKPMRNTMEPAMNEVQLRIAEQLCEKYETSFHMAINDRRFW